MNKGLGGRGKKLPYETMIVRIPVAIKPDVDRLTENYKIEMQFIEKYNKKNIEEDLINLNLMKSELDEYIEEIMFSILNIIQLTYGTKDWDKTYKVFTKLMKYYSPNGIYSFSLEEIELCLQEKECT